MKYGGDARNCNMWVELNEDTHGGNSARYTSCEAKLDLCSAIRNAASDTRDAAGAERPPPGAKEAINASFPTEHRAQR